MKTSFSCLLLVPCVVLGISGGEDPVSFSNRLGIRAFRYMEKGKTNWALSPVNLFSLVLPLVQCEGGGGMPPLLGELGPGPGESPGCVGRWAETLRILEAGGRIPSPFREAFSFWENERFRSVPYIRHLRTAVERLAGKRPGFPGFLKGKSSKEKSLFYFVLEASLSFQGEWEEPFDVWNFERFFELGESPGGRSGYYAPFMTRKGAFKVFPFGPGRVLEIPVMGGEYLAYLFLPRRGGDIEGALGYLEKVGVARLLEEAGKTHSRECRAIVPSFRFRAENDFELFFREIGLVSFLERKLAGDGSGRDFGGIKSTGRIRVDFNRKGVEVQAEYSLGALLGGWNAPPGLFLCNRPFLFFLFHRTTGALVLVGKVMNPFPKKKVVFQPWESVPEHWLGVLEGADGGKKAEAEAALLRLGDKAVPPLLDHAFSGKELESIETLMKKIEVRNPKKVFERIFVEVGGGNLATPPIVLRILGSFLENPFLWNGKESHRWAGEALGILEETIEKGEGGEGWKTRAGCRIAKRLIAAGCGEIVKSFLEKKAGTGPEEGASEDEGGERRRVWKRILEILSPL